MKLHIVAALIVLSSFTAFAGGQHKHMDKLGSKLDLTADQKSKIEAIVREEREKAKPIINSRIREVLTADQKTKFDEMIKRREEKKRNK